VAHSESGYLAVKVPQLALGSFFQVPDAAHGFGHLTLELALTLFDTLTRCFVQLLVGFGGQDLTVEHGSDAQSHGRLEQGESLLVDAVLQLGEHLIALLLQATQDLLTLLCIVLALESAGDLPQ